MPLVFDAPLAGRRILLLPRYSQSGPSSRLRMLQFVPALERAGAEVASAPFFDEAYLAGYFGEGRKSKRHTLAAFQRRFCALRGQNADLYWVEKEIFPYLSGWFEGALARKRARYVVDYDDAIFHAYDRSRHAPVRRLLSSKLDPLLKDAAAVTAGNAYLADYVERHGARSIVRVPTVVDPDRYPVLPAPAEETLRIGWIGTPSNARYLTPLIAALAGLRGRVPVTLVTIGAPVLPDLPVVQERHDWSEAQEATLLTTIDVGVMPLPDDPFERGKCGYKLIQYMAAARPVIASPVGANVDIVDPDVGLLATSPADWARAIEALWRDPDRRAAMGKAGRARVEREYSVQAVTPRIIDTFLRALGERP